jgi:antitoxin HigA-1
MKNKKRVGERSIVAVLPLRGIRAISPGEILLEEFLKPLKMSTAELAKAMGIHRYFVDGIVRGDKVTATMAIWLSNALGTSPEFWLNLQSAMDLQVAREYLKRSSRKT